jgi:hypothetical protein
MRTVLERRLRRRSIITGGVMGFLVAGTLAVPSILPPALADDEPFRTLLSSADELMPKTIDGDDFVKPDFTLEPWVSTEAIGRSTIRKIGYGRTEFVSIVETSTGIYSSDGLESPYIKYPGIHRERSAAPISAITVWDGGWRLMQPLGAGSFVTVLPFDGGSVLMTEDGACVSVRGGLYC